MFRRLMPSLRKLLKIFKRHITGIDFNGDFSLPVNIKIMIDRFQNIINLLNGKQGRGSAADIDRIKRSKRCFYKKPFPAMTALINSGIRWMDEME